MPEMICAQERYVQALLDWMEDGDIFVKAPGDGTLGAFSPSRQEQTYGVWLADFIPPSTTTLGLLADSLTDSELEEVLGVAGLAEAPDTRATDADIIAAISVFDGLHEEFGKVVSRAKAARLAYWEAAGSPRHSEPKAGSLVAWIRAIEAASLEG